MNGAEGIPTERAGKQDGIEAETERTAYCGVDCSACVDLKSGTCPGCRQTVWEGADICLPVACCRKKRIEFCGQCGSFPCEDMKAFYQESESHECAYRRMLSLRGEPPVVK